MNNKVVSLDYIKKIKEDIMQEYCKYGDGEYSTLYFKDDQFRVKKLEGQLELLNKIIERANR